MKCEKCDHEFDYQDPNTTKGYYVIERRSEAFHGSSGKVAFCQKCAPFGNTKIPGKLQ